jgi:hypothetical protein
VDASNFFSRPTRICQGRSLPILREVDEQSQSNVFNPNSFLVSSLLQNCSKLDSRVCWLVLRCHVLERSPRRLRNEMDSARARDVAVHQLIVARGPMLELTMNKSQSD